MLITFVVILVLLGLSASFSSFETALFSLSPLEKHRLRGGSGLAPLIGKVLERPREFLTTVLLGNELVNVGISILGGGLFYKLFRGHDSRVVFLGAIAATTFLVLVFGEILPKNIAIRNRIMVSQLLVLPYNFFAWLMTPFRIVLSYIADRLVGIFGAGSQRRLVVEEEFRALLEMGYEEGTLADLESSLIRNMFDFSSMTISQIMTPRQEIVAVPEGFALKQVFEVLRNHRYSRIPVYRDHPDQWIGILHVKELIRLRLSDSDEIALKSLLKPFAEVSPRQTLSAALEEFRKKRVHIGVVRNDEGFCIGLVTMDDILGRVFS
ncbi:MAG: HlyC/CorC family transporter [Deltaproteobacteria bacterium]|nr:HlyC/CorC family transporter [Deltaproteobacteria bacterium]MBI4374145.1 HlyC/CorC family transporter [Deltaproteobacteria bacterium]